MNLKLLFTSFDGRITRQPYWQGILILLLAWLVLAVAATIAILAKIGVAGPTSGLIWALLKFAQVALAVALVASVLSLVAIPLLIKRLHDRDKSGHYVWLIYGSSVFAQIAEIIGGDQSRFKVHLIAATLVQLWFFIELGFFRGTVGPNAYGPDPLGK